MSRQKVILKTSNESHIWLKIFSDAANMFDLCLFVGISCVCDEIKSDQWPSLSGTFSALIWTASYLAEPILSESGWQRAVWVSIDRGARVWVCLITAICPCAHVCVCVCVCVCRAALITSSHLQVWQNWRGLSDYNLKKIPNKLSLMSQMFLLHRNETKCCQGVESWISYFFLSLECLTDVSTAKIPE